MSDQISLYEVVGGTAFFEELGDCFYGRLILVRDLGIPNAT